MTDERPTRRAVLGATGSTLLAGLAGCAARQRRSGPATSSPEPPLDDPPTDYTRVYRSAIDSVALVRTDRGAGSGFVHDDSHLVTNAHVVGDASTVDVRFAGGEWRTGDVVGTDSNSDLAAVSVDGLPRDAAPLPLADEPAVVGQEVVAIGTPFDLDGTVTTGVVSGVDRSIPAPTGFAIPDAIQTDAAINPGNSGGPLLSLDARVVAVVSLRRGDNVGFGISAALARRVVPELVETGSYEHPYLGVRLATVTPSLADANGLDEPRGLLVVDVIEGTPAAGVLQPSDGSVRVDGRRVPTGGDVLLAVDGTELRTLEDLGSYLALRARPGDTAELTLLRGGRRRTVSITLGTRPS